MMKIKQLLAIVGLTTLLCACDENTSTLGIDMMPSNDFVTLKDTVYNVKTESYEVGDAVLARTSESYLGRFTDPETGTTVKSEFLAQFNCTEGFAFPETIVGDSCTGMDLRLFVKGYVGDTLAPFKLTVYELDKELNPSVKYYTNINPEDYYNPEDKVGSKFFTLSDRTITDSLRWTSNYYRHIRIALPHEKGTEIIKGYKAHPEYFENTYTWMKSGLPCSKGFYFKLESGDGAMAYIDVAQLNVFFRFHDDELDADTTGVCQFSSTKEVVSATRFENYNLDKLMDQKDVTYLRCPAGIFTQATLPVELIEKLAKHDALNDSVSSLNTATLNFIRYNDTTDSEFKLSIPKKLLLVRLDDYKSGFFENYNINDNKTSFLTTFNSANNSYTFDNVSRLVTTLAKEYKEGIKPGKEDTWNKVLLIPVNTTTDSNGNVVKIDHDFSLSSAKLVGGKDPVKLEVIFSSYNE